MFDCKSIEGDPRASEWLNRILSVDHPLVEALRRNVSGGLLIDDEPICPASFEFSVKEDSSRTPLRHGSGLFCEIGFETNGAHPIWFRLGTDSAGNFCGFDVEYGPIAFTAVPRDVTIGDLIGIYPANPEQVTP